MEILSVRDRATVSLGATMLLAVGIDRTRYHAIAPFWYLIGCGTFLAALFALVQVLALDLLFLAAACATFNQASSSTAAH